ncbi:hypothetical protein DL771_000832 [Monosporascus sp. 5C6A]|nr:hypothetical protein DL771_000832 [Monosporascus sp. 5C6A]
MKKAEPYQATSRRDLDSLVILGTAVPTIVLCEGQKIYHIERVNGQACEGSHGEDDDDGFSEGTEQQSVRMNIPYFGLIKIIRPAQTDLRSCNGEEGPPSQGDGVSHITHSNVRDNTHSRMTAANKELTSLNLQQQQIGSWPSATSVAKRLATVGSGLLDASCTILLAGPEQFEICQWLLDLGERDTERRLRQAPFAIQRVAEVARTLLLRHACVSNGNIGLRLCLDVEDVNRCALGGHDFAAARPVPEAAPSDISDGIKSQESPFVLLVRYGQSAPRIPGDPYGVKLKHAGNVSHREDPQRAADFTRFEDIDFTFPDSEKAETLRRLLSNLKKSFLDDSLNSSPQLIVVCDVETERTVEFTLHSYTIRISQFKDVEFSNPDSYYNASRSHEVERKSTVKMDSTEEPMGRAAENYMMAQIMARGESPPDDVKQKKKWYRTLRKRVTREFWVERSVEERAALREKTMIRPEELGAFLIRIEMEDGSHSQDCYYRHYRDWAAAKDPNIYQRVDKDILLVLDQNGDTILAAVSKLFQITFGPETTAKVTKAVNKWSAIPPLPQPDTSRHMVDELIRQTHPELNMELARSPEELEKRSMCVVHYGTWAQRGHHAQPGDVYLTHDTRLFRGTSFKESPDYPSELFPDFKKGALGITSDVARFLLAAIEPKYYQECIEYFQALPKPKRMAVSSPNWATLIVLGIRSFTERHKDTADVKFGLATIVALGEYSGGDLCFPQTGLALAYQPGCCVMFRGAEMEHFVSEWTGNRIFMAFTNHQAVRNWINRQALGVALPQISAQDAADEEHGEDCDSDHDSDPCVEKNLDIDNDEDLTDKEIHGPGTWSPGRNFPDYSSSSSNSTSNPAYSVAASYDISEDGVKRRKLTDPAS